MAPADGRVAADGKTDTGAPARAPVPLIYGALDLGTNNCRLLIAKPSRRGFLVIDAFSRIIRLGEGALSSGRLSDAAMSRTIEALKVCADKMGRRAVTRSRLIATEACRIAANSNEFIERARAETGLSIEIVSQETEAKLAVSGCASLIDRSCDFTLVFDIGGGSSELIWLDLAQLGRPWRRTLHDRIDVQSCIAAWTSLPIGVVSLAERHGGRDVTPENYEAMVADVMKAHRKLRAAASLRRPDRQPARPFPRHFGHGYHHLRHSSQAADVRPLAGRRLLALGPRRAHRVERVDRHDLRRARGATVHRA